MPYQILIVEDEMSLQFALSELLKDEGYIISDHIGEGQAALASFRKNQPDLVLMDICLKGELDGIETAERMRSLDNVPLIFMTASIEKGFFERAIHIHPHGYIQKPIDHDILLQTIAMALDRSQAQRVAEENQRKYEAFFNASMDGFLFMKKGRVINANPAALQLLKVADISQVIGKSLLALSPINQKNGQASKALYRIYLQEAKRSDCYRFHWLFCRFDEIMIEVEVTFFFLSLRGEDILLASFRDVGERLRNERILQKRANQMHLIYEVGLKITQELNPDKVSRAIVETIYERFDLFSVALWLTDESAKMLRLSTITGGFKSLFSPDLAVPYGQGLIGKAALTRLVQLANDVRECTDFFRLANEQTLSALVIPILSGKEMLGVLDIQSLHLNAFTPSDVFALETLSVQVATALQNAQLYEQAQEELAQRAMAEWELKVANDELDQIFNSSVDGMRVIGRNFDVLRVNKTFLQVFNLEESDVVGRKCYQSFPSTVCHTLECPLFQISSPEDRFEREVRTHHTDQESVPCLMTGSAYYGRDGKRVGIVEAVHDLRDRKMLEYQLLQAQKLESIGQLAAGIAHEINTPMQYIGDNTRFFQSALEDLLKITDLLKHSLPHGLPPGQEMMRFNQMVENADLAFLSQEMPEALKQTLEGIERVNQIVRSMKDFSHPSTEEMTPVDVNRALKSTLTISKNAWKYISEVNLELGRGLPLIQAYPGELNQVFLNLIVNAAHAIEEKNVGNEGSLGVITVRTRKDGDFIRVEIEDDGGGIPKEIQNKIFNPFFTTKKVGVGTGQGLAISHQIIVERHRGSLDFRSEAGRGALFIVRLPSQAV